MPNIFSVKPSCILIGSLVFLLFSISSCHQYTNKSPQNRQTIQTQPPLVEQQLLATIKDAEKLGPGNPLLLSSLYSLANFYHDRKEYDKAANQYERALHIKERMSGPNHPDIAEILKRYARVLQEAKRPHQAANLLARADAILAQSN
jgi:tetratricopeptide (TPR) repeat protein